jgi:hypothetical protein
LAALGSEAPESRFDLRLAAVDGHAQAGDLLGLAPEPSREGSGRRLGQSLLDGLGQDVVNRLGREAGLGRGLFQDRLKDLGGQIVCGRGRLGADISLLARLARAFLANILCLSSFDMRLKRNFSSNLLFSLSSSLL